MHRSFGLLAILLAASIFAGCSQTYSPGGDEDLSPQDEPEMSVVIEPVPQLEDEQDEGFVVEEGKIDTPTYPADELSLSMEQGGNFVKMGSKAVFISESGGIALADLNEKEYHFISDSVSSRLYFDGTNIFYSSDSGIYCLSGEGENHCLSEDLTYRLWLDNRKIYYIKQTNLQSDEPVGELWCMDKNGQNAVVILPTEIIGEFCVRDGWIYYVSAEDSCLYRTMLFGSQPIELAEGSVEIRLVTESSLYYQDKAGRRTVRRLDLKTNAVVSMGAYGSVMKIDDMIYVMARRERAGGMENLFSLVSFSEKESQNRQIIEFENIGEDQLAYFWDGYVYMRRSSGGIYRIAVEDTAQGKDDILPDDAVFVEGMAYYMSEGRLNIFDLTNESTTQIIGK